MDGFGGQQVIVDFDSGRIIVVHSLDRHYNWKKIVHKKLNRNKKTPRNFFLRVSNLFNFCI